ncbi:sugar transferase [Sediminispirochaeta bajacaliforniensis]|uniref:sugar transferase n=1 Tax=Sediminispirochaeta bajacaliforniensis TaxID=148 RepID=UPI00036C6A58|nr:sugar transferase [Sediminispirochaeta bajacaliforniensis]
MNRRRRVFVRNALMAIDGIVTFFSFIVAYYVRNTPFFFGLKALFPFSNYFPYLLISLVFWLLLLRFFNNYAFLGGGKKSWRRIFVNLLPVELVGLALLTMILFFLRDQIISRTFLLFFAAINYLMLLMTKILTMAYFLREGKIKKYHRRALLVGNKRSVDYFLSTEKQMPELLFDIITQSEFIINADAVLNEKEQEELSEAILDFIWNNVVDEVIFAYSDLNLASISSLVTECGRMGISVNVVLDTSNIEFRKSEVDVVGPFNIITFQTFDYSPVQRLVKRLTDISAGIIGTLICSLLFVVIAPLIKITSPGPILFRQVRKGKNGRNFVLLKFRTMCLDAEDQKRSLLDKNEMQGQIFKMKYDPRITPLGNFLRRTSLDEWPQFINILRGDMSLVGTRPPTVEEFGSYRNYHRRRLSVKPGLTGLWQVSGRNDISDFEEIVKLDTWYIDHWSIWLDLKIILKTFLVLFRGR